MFYLGLYRQSKYIYIYIYIYIYRNELDNACELDVDYGDFKDIEKKLQIKY